MGAKRSVERMEALHERLVRGMEARGIDTATAEIIFDKLSAFADFGFPESHAFSFAYLVYASAWLKARKPEDFYAGVLAAQPMGFWSPQTLVADARRHGVRVLPADVNFSREQAGVEPRDDADAAHTGLHADPNALSPLDVHPELAVRLGLAPIKGLGDAAADIVAERSAHGPYTDIADLARRVRLSRSRLETLAACGALASLGVARREALWSAGVLSQEYGQRHGHGNTRDHTRLAWSQPPLPGTAVGARAPRLPDMTDRERQDADLHLTGVSTQDSPIVFHRDRLTAAGVFAVAEVLRHEPGRRVRVAGLVTHRQRPDTSSGTIFLNLEDETGLLNVICPAGMWRRYRDVGRRAAALVVRGMVESGDGVTALVAEQLTPLPGITSPGSRDWC